MDFLDKWLERNNGLYRFVYNTIIYSSSFRSNKNYNWVNPTNDSF